jgi:NADH-quinone oxidoreductase subunit M
MSLREHIALCPLAVLFLVMGVASPIFMKAIDIVGAQIAHTVNQTGSTTVNFEANIEGGQR